MTFGGLCSTSLRADHYEEARSAQSRRDFVHKTSLASKELRESLYWLGLIHRAELVRGFDLEALLDEGNQLVAILMSSVRTASRGRIGIQTDDRESEFKSEQRMEMQTGPGTEPV